MSHPRADAPAVNLVHRLNFSRTSHRPAPTAFDKPLRGASRHGWTVDLARYGTTITHLRITDPHGTAVILTSDAPRIPTVKGALARMPVHDLEALFDFDHPSRTEAWAAIPRLHVLALPLDPAADAADLRQSLSWANVSYADELAWRAAGLTSGLDALYYTRNALTPARIAVYTMQAPPMRGWHRADLALYARHDLDQPTAHAWAALDLSHQTVALFLDTGYTATDVRDLKDILRRQREPMQEHRWALARVPVAIAVAAIAAGVTPDEATSLTVDDLDTLAAMAALRT